ncbi:sensor histidine kinase [Algoriphagus sp. NBT04N3]|uniref:tetratricopeptide repeat-containing sensor histidine kinase n=1 Tax=Algoriphagus sp. NBT04N3 TaxID=2705473 RepID=UPI001C636522|nr:tetratricopeptide repeat protein [Algoriphagus sp. NBT04N3]QYH39009.1 sensor histidine kinase [Algoriphagus sp. NBT04N3]
MKKLRLFCVPLFSFFLLVSAALAQNASIDSLKNSLSISEGKDRLDILIELAFSLREISQGEALAYALEAEKLAQELDNPSAESQATEHISWIYYRQGLWQKAFDFAKESYQLAREANDLKQVARVLNNMGALYYEQQNYLMAIDHFKDAFEISQKAKDVYTQIRSLNNVAFNFTLLENYDSALFYAKNAIRVNEENGSPYLTSFSNRVIGDVYFQKGKLDSAQLIYEKSLAMARQQGLSTFMASVLHRLGNTYLQLGKLNQAEEILEEGITISSQNNFRDELAKSHKYMAQVMAEKGQVNRAFEHLNIYSKINDSLVDKSNRDRIALMQGMFQQNLEKSELELLKAQNENQANRLAFINRVVWIISICGGLIIALLVWLFNLKRNVDKYNRELIIQQNKIEEQNRHLEQSAKQLEEINQTKNKLFSILGHDLRGPVGQLKTIIDMTVNNQLSQSEFEELLPTMKRDLDSVHFTLSNTLRWSTAQMEGFTVNPTKVNLRTIVDATLSLLDAQLKAKQIEILVEMPEHLEVCLDKDLMEVIVRNILNNAIKYSEKGNKILVTVTENQGVLEWCVKDEGIGMSEGQIQKILSDEYSITNSRLGTNNEKGSGLGLQVCKEFIRLINGELSIESEPNKGSKVCVNIPVEVLESNRELVNS